MSISWGAVTECLTTKTQSNRAFLEGTNEITFNRYPDQRRPLYLVASINQIPIKRALGDTGALVNLIPLSRLQVVEILENKILGSSWRWQDSEERASTWQGEYIQLWLKVGLIASLARFHVVKTKVLYHILLGWPLLHKHRLIPPTCHQCVKGRLNGRMIRFEANPTPFEQAKAH